MRPLLIPLVLLAVAPPRAVAQPLSLQEALLRAKPAVALVVGEVASEVTVSCGAGGERRVNPPPYRETGSGWVVDPSGWLVTNGHVVSPAHRPPEWLAREQMNHGVRAACLPPLLARRGLRLGQRLEVEEELARQLPRSVLRTARVKLAPSLSVILSNGVRVPATVAKYSPPVAGESMSGRDLALLRLEAADLPSLPLADSGAARLGDPLHILGFPGVVLSHELLNASAKVEASVTSGAISGFRQDVANQPVIQTDAPAGWGNSGGPAVTPNGEVIGVLTFVSLESARRGALVQGFNFVIPSAAVREFVKGTDAALGRSGAFDRAWRAALGAFFGGDHARAATLLAEANRLQPDFPDVRRVSAENDRQLRNPPPRPFPWATAAAALALGGAGALAAVAGAGWRRNRHRIRPAEVARLLEAPVPPVILDVRDDAAYAKSPVRIPNAHHVTGEQLRAGAVPVAADRLVVAYCT